MPKLNVVLRTCDRVSLASDRIVPKNQCVVRCLNSLVQSLRNAPGLEYTLHIIDDNSSDETRQLMQAIATEATWNLLPGRDEEHLNGKQKSRYSVGVAYEHIYQLPTDDLVYVVEDDYLHYSDSIERMLEAQKYFSEVVDNKHIGIFPQDFPELYAHPRNRFNSTYTQACWVVPGPDRYYRTTWFTHESFLIPLQVIWKYKKDFDRLMVIGTEEGAWEGNTISNAWAQPDVAMLMPMRSLALHVSRQDDLPFFNTDFELLWQANNVS